jgi:hypothetical protein
MVEEAWFIVMENKITVRQAFDVMTAFLTIYWKKTGSDEVACLLSDMNTEIWADGSTGDPAIWGEWIGCIDEVTNTENADILTVLQAFQAMKRFLGQYIPFNTSSDAVDALKSGVHVYKDGSIANPAFWETWIECVTKDVVEKRD